jgi:hypothetical protein
MRVAPIVKKMVKGEQMEAMGTMAQAARTAARVGLAKMELAAEVVPMAITVSMEETV